MLRPVALLSALLLALPAGAVETLRIAMDARSGAVQVRAASLAMGPDTEEATFHPVPGGRATVAMDGRQLTVNGEPVPGQSVRFRAVPSAGGAATGSLLHAGGRTVRGDVVVLRQRRRLVLVNVIALEDYLAAMVGSEMPVSFPPEALKAQAVAARTYALHKKLQAYDAPYHLGSSVLHQVYSGAHREDPRSRAAVEATRGQVLTYELAPIEAYFHASCGGRTESGLDALGRELPYLTPVDCGCGRLPASRWTLTVPEDELQRVTGAPAHTLGVGERTGTGRARWLTAAGQRRMDAVTFRQKLGYSRLRSLDFELEPLAGRGQVRIVGRGYGHGAGLCQWGAKVAAEAGWDYQRILAHYYPGTELQPLY